MRFPIVMAWIPSVSPIGDQEGTAYNGHFACTCYHPLFQRSDQFAIWNGATLRPGNVA